MSPSASSLGQLDLETFVSDFAVGLQVADARRPVAVNQRSKEAFQGGVGPHTESAAIKLVMDELRVMQPARYGAVDLGVPYPKQPRQNCDLCLGTRPNWRWAIEVKLLRFLGDNGQPNDNILMHILSPHPAHRSAVTDTTKLIESGLAERRAILIYGFEAADWPLEPAIDAFERLARARVDLGQRAQAEFRGLGAAAGRVSRAGCRSTREKAVTHKGRE